MEPTLDTLISQGDEFLRVFGALETIPQSGGKIGVSGEGSYVSWNWFQGLQRAYYRENRERTTMYFVQQTREYLEYFGKLLLFVREQVQDPLACFVDAAEYLRKHRTKCEKWIEGLQVLKQQYGEEPSVWREIDDVIIALGKVRESRI